MMIIHLARKYEKENPAMIVNGVGEFQGSIVSSFSLSSHALEACCW